MPRTQNSSPKRWILLDWEETDLAPHSRVGHVIGRYVVRGEQGELLNAPERRYFEKVDYQTLEISSQISENTEHSYGWDVRYRTGYRYSLKLDDVEAMARTLRMIKVGQDRLDRKFGYPADFGQYVTRVGEVTGVVGYMCRVGPETNSHRTNEYREMDVKAAQFHIAHLFSEWHKRFAKEEAA